MTTRHPPTSSLHLQHQLKLVLLNEDYDPRLPEATVASTPCTLTISYHWESTDNGHPTPNSPAWSPAAHLKQWWVPICDKINLSVQDQFFDLEAFDLNDSDPLIIQLLSHLDPRDFPLPPPP